MLLINCPHCGPRNSDEFTFGGEPARRPSPDSTTSNEWRRYLYIRDNVAGWEQEQWFHVAGCRRFLTAERDTTTNELRNVRDAGQGAP